MANTRHFRMAESEIGLRIKEAAASVGGLNRLAEAVGIPRRTLGDQIIKDEQKVSFLLEVSRQTGYQLQWLATGEGEKKTVAAQSQGGLSQSQATTTAVGSRSDLVPVPLYNVRAAAGNGIVAVDEQEPREEVILTRTFLRRLGAQAESCHIIFAKGESMQPTIPDGSLLLIDLSKSQIVDNGVFVFRVGEDIKVKRARWRLDQRIDLVSDNQLAGYPPETYTLDEVTDIQPIGRVMCIMRVP